MAQAGSIVSPDEGNEKQPLGLLLVAIPVLLIVWLVIWPIISAVIDTLWRSDGHGHVGFDASSYVFFFTDTYSLNNLALTLWTTGICAALLLICCLPIALYLRFGRGRITGYVQTLAILPLFVPSIILAYAFIRVLGPNGFYDIVLHGLGLPKLRTPYLTPWGPVIGLVWDNIPLTVLILLSGLGSVKDQAVEAARDVGANRLQVLRHIIMPTISNSILVALSFAVLGIFSAFTLPYLLGPASPEMMGPFMQRTFDDVNDPVAAVTQAVISFAFCILFGLFYVRSVARNQGRQP
ncbi:ABC transporter permease subunit [Jiella sp. MQZ9-1]|uniref:ABC transporter permease subunit n=1 Tax=Jiella flava TaxID=2816857 RepID=A0A939FX63_9HYPH|nr:ABC transporter permease subunit [Jiella flava]MBO0662514.1 ABC transporter permease subunit [Jiella flava]MCD2471739.1 ABC transporter permease subunit [Jiella flava]